MKNLFAMVALVAVMTQLSYGQEQNKFRLGLDFGYAVPDGGGGVLIALEPKFNLGDNMNIGLRYESATLAKNISSEGISLEAELAASSSLLGTFDYYFTSGRSSFAPFIGAGVGYSSLASLEIGLLSDLAAEDLEVLEVDGKFGGLIRAGFEAGKFRMAAAYNLIGKSDLGDGVETKNSYIGISLGFYLGGGKWKS